MRLIDAPIRIIISIPIARRSIGDYQSGSSSGLDSWLCCAFPYESYSDIIAASLFLTAAGPRRLIPAFLLSLATPDSSYAVINNGSMAPVDCQGRGAMPRMVIFITSTDIPVVYSTDCCTSSLTLCRSWQIFSP